MRSACKAEGDAKVLAVPTDDICPLFSCWKSIEDVPEARLSQIRHFFEHYKDLEPGKWIRVIGWSDLMAAHEEISSGAPRYATSRPAAP